MSSATTPPGATPSNAVVPRYQSHLADDPPLTDEEPEVDPLMALYDSDLFYEEIDDQIVEVPGMGVYEAWIASQLLLRLIGQRMGRVVIEGMFDFKAATGKKRRPDLAFVSYERWPREKPVPRAEAWDVVPNLAVEVASPSNSANVILEKIADYFKVGIERVWVIHPMQRNVYVYTSPTNVTILAEQDELIDEQLLPGFRMALGELFDDTAQAN